MIVRTSVLAASLAGLTAAVAFAADTAATPRALALRASDFPAGAKVSGISSTSGPGGSVYSASFSFKVNGREEEVSDKVWVVPRNAKPLVPGLAAGPKATYGSEVGQISGFPHETSLSLPQYGDQQTGNWAGYKNADGAVRARSALVVLKGNVVWVLTVENCGDLAPYGCFFGPRPPKIAKAVALGELKKYALKQQARVGNA